jgi:hypothetical protein
MLEVLKFSPSIHDYTEHINVQSSAVSGSEPLNHTTSIRLSELPTSKAWTVFSQKGNVGQINIALFPSSFYFDLRFQKTQKSWKVWLSRSKSAFTKDTCFRTNLTVAQIPDDIEECSPWGSLRIQLRTFHSFPFPGAIKLSQEPHRRHPQPLLLS